MKNIFLTRLAAAALLVSLASSCDKLLDVKPQASLPAETALTTKQGVEAALIGAYDAVQSGNYWGLRYILFADMGADNVRWTGTLPSFQQINQNNITADNVELSSMWSSIYSGINRANYVIEAAGALSDPSYTPATAIAQARALRAFHYMNLLGFWGGTPEGYNKPGGVGVPLRLTPTKDISDAQIAPIPRSTEQQIIQVINDDFDYAIANLPTAYTSANNQNRGRITKNAAIALKARFALRNGDYPTVISLTAPLRDASGNLPLSANYVDLWALKNQQESIWELQYDATDANSIAFYWYPTANGGRNEVDPATGLPAAHETGDKRLPVNVNSSPAGTTQKFSRVTGDDNVILVRNGETILNRAEALARVGGVANLTEAVKLLNLIRVRAGLAAYVLTPTATDLTGQTGLVAAILKERRVELAHEGHRWFDLRRTGTVLSTLTGVTQPFRVLWPIPQREVLNSSGTITQNTGY
ncbi:RagB/SusD family nutrient uptake outer membrane protein [Hymenobacter fodinae]|uniref:RagB/SusD family nutrient uptake outer membrane protein n=1 Tax=Hymenobacter fodinae TaxID=2510796 RepID=A0A4Z0PEZ8_9BACT|nr:RagB/SusD family nutrient uptake outer membrane protein [Hymenobacter fodinae]TGE10360.1 RagB/SusD family nutrient uptake outer membrane protein [Hymenobacter fodinae]